MLKEKKKAITNENKLVKFSENHLFYHYQCQKTDSNYLTVKVSFYNYKYDIRKLNINQTNWIIW